MKRLSRRGFLRGVAPALAVSAGALAPARARSQTQAPSQDQPQASRSYVLATATPAETAYPVGVALATLVKIKVAPTLGLGLSAIATTGSGENVRLLNGGAADLAILQGLFAWYAWRGTGPLADLGPQTRLRAITLLWPNVEHIVVRRDLAASGTVADLSAVRGNRVCLGTLGSGTLASNRVLFAHLGYGIERDFDLVHLGYRESADALIAGDVAALSAPGGAPVSAVTRVLAAMGEEAALLSFTEAEAVSADGDFGLWRPHVIPAGTYPGQAGDIGTLAQPNVLVAAEGVPADDVHALTRAIFENLEFLGGVHPATRAMSPDRAVGGLPLPLHPGAERYFREAGVAIDPALRAP